MEEIIIVVLSGVIGLMTLFFALKWKNYFVRGQPTEINEDDCPLDLLLFMELQNTLSKDWKDFGRVLGIQEAKLQQLEMDYRYNVREAIYQMLMTWKNGNSRTATVDELIESLKSISRTDIADRIFSMSSQRKAESNLTRQQPRWKRSRLFSSEKSLTLQRLQANLRQKYKMFQMRGLPWMENVFLSLEKHFVQLQIINKNRDGGDQPEEKLELHQLFEPISSCGDNPSRILVEGPAGFGKTTFATKLCYDYAYQKRYINQFNLVLFFALRNFDGNLEVMICNAAFVSETQVLPLLELINSSSTRTLLILDGYDELPNEHADSILALIRGELLPNVTLILTSRPGNLSSNESAWYSEHIITVSKDVGFDMTQIWDKQIKIMGISVERQPEFIEKHLSTLPVSHRLKIEEQLTKMKDMNIVTPDFLQCPLFFLMILLLLTEESINLQQLKTRTDLYKSIMNFIMCRYLAKFGSPCSTKVDLFSIDNNSPKAHYIVLMRQLGQVSLAAIKDNRLHLNEQDVSGLDPRILELGFLTRIVADKGLQKVTYYEPVHKSLFEFSAAYFLWTEFIVGRRENWRANLIQMRPTTDTYKSSLVFPFLAGLLGTDAAALFQALKPYAPEYSAMFYILTHALSEIQVTEPVLSSLKPFLPIIWQTYWRLTSSTASAVPFEVMREFLKLGKIKQLVWNLTFPIVFNEDIEVDRIMLHFENGMTRLSKSQFKCIKCRSLLCEFFHYSSTLGNKWGDFLALLSSIQFQHISFFLYDAFSTSIFQPLIYEALEHGALKNAKIHYIQFEISKDTSHLLDLLIPFIQSERINALWITISCPVSQEKLDSLFKAIAKSSNLTKFILFYEYGSLPMTVNFDQLHNGGKKRFQRLCIENVTSEHSLVEQNSNLQVELLELPRVYPTASFLNSCNVASFTGDYSILACDYHPLHQSLTELNIIIDETFFQQELFTGIGKFRNLQVLTLTMTSARYLATENDKRLFEAIERLSALRGIEIGYVENNYPFAVAIVDGIIDYIKQKSDDRKTSFPFITSSERKHSILEYVQLQSRLDARINGSYSSISSNIQEFISLVLCLKQALVKKMLPRLSIVIAYETFLLYMAKFKPSGFSSFVEMFPPGEHFVVTHDYVGMKEDDSIHNKKAIGAIHTWQHRFDVSLN